MAPNLTRLLSSLLLALSMQVSYGAQRAVPARPPKTLDFDLRDSNGRRVSSRDYQGVPVFVEFGSSWCGGCQEDGAKLAQLAADFAPRGLAVIRCVAGDNELAAIEFQKHYRLNVVSLLDPNRAFEKTHNRDGWPFYLLADSTGKIVYASNNAGNWKALEPLMKSLCKNPPPQTKTLDGVPYMTATLKRSGELEKPLRRDRFPSIACGADGRVYVVFTSGGNGNDDVFVRVFDGKAWSEDYPVAATADDEFDGTVVVDSKNQPWFCWTGDSGGRYDVFVASASGPSRISGAEQVTRSDDDAMHPRMAAGGNGRLYLTYYKWARSGSISRDREVYLRSYDGTAWSGEVQVSPTDVPWYEDHFDPVVCASGDGAVVAWSWDFHQPENYRVKAAEPTIFLRTAAPDLKLGRIRAVSGTSIDTMPSLAVDGKGVPWCAWESITRDDTRGVCVATASDSGSQGAALTANMANVCTPRLALSPSGVLTAVWAETASGDQWALRRAALDSKTGRWSAPATIVAAGNPRFPSISFAPDGALWVAWSAETKTGVEILVKSFPAPPSVK